MPALPERRSASLVVPPGYPSRAGWAIAVFYAVRVRPLPTVLLIVIGAALIVTSVADGVHLSGVVAGIAIIALRALLVVGVAVATAAATKTASPPGSRLALTLDASSVELASAATTVRFDRAEVDRVTRWLGFVWLRRGRRLAWIGIPVELVDGAPAPAETPQAPPAERPPAPPAGTPQAPPAGTGSPSETGSPSAEGEEPAALIESRVLSDPEWIRAIGRDLFLLFLPWALIPIVVGWGTAFLAVVGSGSLDALTETVLAVLLAVLVAVVLTATSFGLRRGVRRQFPEGSEIRLRVDRDRITTRTARVTVTRSTASVRRIVRRRGLLVLRMRGGVMAWLPGGLLDDAGLAELRSLVGASR